MCGHLRLTLTGKESLLVSLNPYDAHRGFKVRKVPHLLTDHVVKLVDDLMIGLKLSHLRLLSKWNVIHRMESGYSICAILREHHRLVRISFLPLLKFLP